MTTFPGKPQHINIYTSRGRGLNTFDSVVALSGTKSTAGWRSFFECKTII